MQKILKSKIILLVTVTVLLLSATFKSKAQAEFGMRIMPTFSALNLKNSNGIFYKGKATVGIGFAALLGYNFSDNVGVEGDIIFNTMVQKYEDQGVENKINLRYINIPLLIAVNTGKTKMVNLNLVVGPQFGFRVGSTLTTTGNNGNNFPVPVLLVKKNDIGLAYGGGLQFGLNESNTTHLDIGYRGVYGLIDISDNSKTTATNSYYILDRTHTKTNAVYLGVSFLF